MVSHSGSTSRLLYFKRFDPQARGSLQLCLCLCLRSCGMPRLWCWTKTLFASNRVTFRRLRRWDLNRSFGHLDVYTTRIGRGMTFQTSRFVRPAPVPAIFFFFFYNKYPRVPHGSGISRYLNYSSTIYHPKYTDSINFVK